MWHFVGNNLALRIPGQCSRGHILIYIYNLFRVISPYQETQINTVSFSSRLVEEVKLRAGSCQLQNEDVYMNCTFQDFIQMCVRKLRGEDDEEELIVDYVSGCYRIVLVPDGPLQRPRVYFLVHCLTP